MKDANPFKAGLFIITSFLIALVLFFGITGADVIGPPGATYRVAFDLSEDVSGLKRGSDVRIGGIRVGKVRAITLEAHTPATADHTDGSVPSNESEKPVQKLRSVVTFTAPKAHALHRNARISIQTGLTGQVNLNISDTGSGELLSSSDILDGAASPLNLAVAGLGSVADEILPLVRDIRQTSVPKANLALDNAATAFATADKSAEQIRISAAEADALLKHVRTKVDPVTERYNTVADNAAGAMANLRDILGDSSSDIRSTMSNMNSATTTLKDRLPEIASKVSDTLDSFKIALDKTSVALDDIQKTAANTSAITGDVRSLLSRNRSRIDEIIRSVNLTASNLEAASTEIRRSPWRLLYKPKASEVANQNLYDAARHFADGARRLQDSAANLRDTLADPQAPADQIQKLLNDLSTTFNDYQKIEAHLWDQVQE